MATSCELDLTIDEKKQFLYYSISIPYEVNHDFLYKADLAAKRGEIQGLESVIHFDDYGRGITYLGKDIDLCIQSLSNIENNIDEILEIIPIPENISLHDGSIIVGYEIKKTFKDGLWVRDIPYTTVATTSLDNYITLGKRDILYIIGLIKALALKAKNTNKGIKFIGE